MNLSKILNYIEAVHVSGNAEAKEIDAIELDSRKVKDGSIFVAIKGFRADGHEFIVQAIGGGASAVVLEDDSKVPNELFIVNDVVKIVVKDSRRALSSISNILFEKPSEKLKIIGVTGTKGKTTTAYFIKNIIEEAGKASGLIGTNKYIVGNKEYKATHTTPEANVINKLLREMLSEGCEYAVMEVSSHSIDLHRVSDIDFNCVVFTNITSDHLDYHKTFEGYRAAKAKLFEQLSGKAKAALNADDANAKFMADITKAEKIFYGSAADNNYIIKDIKYSLSGTEWKIIFGGKEFKMNTCLIGKFNAYNATAAFAACVESGIEPETAVRGISSMPQVPGRFEVLSKGNKKVIVDYSHTSDSLEQALKSVCHLLKADEKIYTVFGCGGDRDKTKRPVMGAIAEKYSDYVIVTSDNPRSEVPMKIIEDIIKGMKTKNFRVIENREEAIKFAVTGSPENAVILIAGKGHENYQEINGVRRYFSDKDMAIKYLSEIE